MQTARFLLVAPIVFTAAVSGSHNPQYDLAPPVVKTVAPPKVEEHATVASYGSASGDLLVASFCNACQTNDLKTAQRMMRRFQTMYPLSANAKAALLKASKNVTNPSFKLLASVYYEED